MKRIYTASLLLMLGFASARAMDGCEVPNTRSYDSIVADLKNAIESNDGPDFENYLRELHTQGQKLEDADKQKLTQLACDKGLGSVIDTLLQYQNQSIASLGGESDVYRVALKGLRHSINTNDPSFFYTALNALHEQGLRLKDADKQDFTDLACAKKLPSVIETLLNYSNQPIANGNAAYPDGDSITLFVDGIEVRGVSNGNTGFLPLKTNFDVNSSDHPSQLGSRAAIMDEKGIDREQIKELRAVLEKTPKEKITDFKNRAVNAMAVPLMCNHNSENGNNNNNNNDNNNDAVDFKAWQKENYGSSLQTQGSNVGMEKDGFSDEINSNEEEKSSSEEGESSSLSSTDDASE